MQLTTVETTVTRPRVGPAWISGPAALVAVLAIVIIALGAGLAVVIITGQGAGAMP
jgi:hypothetical protein